MGSRLGGTNCTLLSPMWVPASPETPQRLPRDPPATQRAPGYVRRTFWRLACPSTPVWCLMHPRTPFFGVMPGFSSTDNVGIHCLRCFFSE